MNHLQQNDVQLWTIIRIHVYSYMEIKYIRYNKLLK
jgi:hypothetical protein